MFRALFKLQTWARWLKRVVQVLWKAVGKFFEIDGEQRAASFAYYAFFALFPLILLFVTIGSQFLDNATVTRYVIEYLGQYLPFNPSDKGIVEGTIHGVLDSRGKASLLAILGLLWSSTHFFHAIVRGVNRAWGTVEYPWWRLPMHSMAMLLLVASALFIGVVSPLILNWVQHFALMRAVVFTTVFQNVLLLVPSVVLFYGFSMLFKFAPRRPTRFSEVVLGALFTTFLLQLCRQLFEMYVYRISNFNAVYGTFAVVIVLLMWIYLSGVIIIFGGCVCAAQAELFGTKNRPPGEEHDEFEADGQLR